MDTTPYEINYNNFQPSDDIKTAIYSNVQNLLMTAPSDAYLQVSVVLHRQLYKIELKLCSKVKTIQKNVVGKNLLSSLKELQESVADTLLDWKKSRNFSHEALT